MNIAMFSDTYLPQVNGVVTMIRLLEENLREMGHKVYIYTVDHPKATKSDYVYRIPSVKFPWEKDQRIGFPVDYKKIVKDVSAKEIDIIHAHTPVIVGYVARFVAKSLKIPCVNTYHTMMEEYVHYIPFMEPLLRVYMRGETKRFCNHYSVVIVPSEKIKKLLLGYGVTAPIEVIPNGVKLEPFHKEFSKQEVTEFWKRFDIPPERRIFIFVGRLGKEKSIDKLLENMERLLRVKENAHLLIVGGGPQEGYLRRMASSMRIGDNVTFTGYLNWPDEVSLAYHSSDVFVIASHTETFGLVVLEAIAAGLPVIAYKDDSFTGMVIDGENGFLCPDKERMHESMLKLMENDHMLREFSENSRRLSLGFSDDENAKKTLRLYERVVNRHS
ncbi:MAG TPA: glycosyltransferase family 4 protein [Kosmotogaceae bacterium]|nr:MAG: Glycosyltransferase [Thermotogales bacterium 46_20]HAA84900.1 glycosyltransferase family 4 protein [Kosmotogaceae bacterium]